MFENVFIVAKYKLRRTIRCNKSRSLIHSAIRPMVNSIAFLLWPSASSSSDFLHCSTNYIESVSVADSRRGHCLKSDEGATPIEASTGSESASDSVSGSSSNVITPSSSEADSAGDILLPPNTDPALVAEEPN
uniref:Integrase core domain containing protein n=1 Tax=Solanum tuberosum TaxID=4113 RepID=M1DLV2_SOLTU